MWRKFHVLNETQVFGLTALCAVVIAAAIGIASTPAPRASLNPFFAASRDFDPYINSGLTFVLIIPVFLAYYHLGRIGIFVGVSIGALAAYLSCLCAWFFFVLEVLGRSRVLEVIAYTCSCLLLAAIVFVTHLKLAKSRSIQSAQRLLRLSHSSKP